MNEGAALEDPASPGMETWQLRKPAVACNGGIVVSQHRVASRVGAAVLAAGGNAVDAAVSAGLAIGTVEPWMSGLGGGGFMVVYQAGAGRAEVVDFGMSAPAGLDVARYPLAGGGTDDDLFGWPAVRGDHNVHGPLSIAVPGFVAGHALALERFGSRSWAEAIAPAVDLAERGMPVDWYATLKIASEAALLARYEESARVYLPGGFAPAGAWAGAAPGIRLGRLAETLRRLAQAGPADFYQGEIAARIVADAGASGSPLGAADLAAYRARVVPAVAGTYRGARVHAAPGLSAGPSLLRALELMADRDLGGGTGDRAPDAGAYLAYAESLAQAYRERLASIGHAAEAPHAPACTTHLSVVDRDGNAVALTQTLLSVFGSKVVLPQTGILMNNGIMWFDPRPGRPNSMAPGRRPLSNMCPTVLEREDGLLVALGASGGRRIMPAVCQLISFLVDFRMDLDAAMHQGRIDASGGAELLVDASLPPAVAGALAHLGPCHVVQHGVYPALFACPNVAARDRHGARSIGAAFVTSPWAQACPE